MTGRWNTMAQPLGRTPSSRPPQVMRPRETGISPMAARSKRGLAGAVRADQNSRERRRQNVSEILSRIVTSPATIRDF